MNNSKLSYGLNLTRKPGLSKPGPPKRRPVFGDDDGYDDGSDDKPSRPSTGQAEKISEFDDSVPTHSTQETSRIGSKSKKGPPSRPPFSKHKTQVAEFGDLSSALTSRKYAEDAEKLDPSIYDYDASYDSFKAARKTETSEADRKPQYMSHLKKMAEIRERDRRIAEDKKMQREREAEGEEFADKEKFVTEAYTKQQEENRRLEEEERKREESEAKKNQSGGMTGFYKQLLDTGETRHAEAMKAAEQRLKSGPPKEEEVEEKGKTDADLAREINKKGGSVAINEDGEVVDKRQLLKGGLNVGAKKAAEAQEAARKAASTARTNQSHGHFAGGKQAMRDRQSRMLEAQYEQALKHSRDEEDKERQKVEMESKTRKTDADISSAKERYLARKRAEGRGKEGRDCSRTMSMGEREKYHTVGNGDELMVQCTVAGVV